MELVLNVGRKVKMKYSKNQQASSRKLPLLSHLRKKKERLIRPMNKGNQWIQVRCNSPCSKMF